MNLKLDEIENLFLVETPAPGRLATMPGPAAFELDDRFQSLANAGFSRIVSLISDEEVVAMGLEEANVAAATAGLEFTRFPIGDYQVPAEAPVFIELVDSIADDLKEGRSVAVHCKGGVGRAGLAASSVLARLGLEASAAIARVSAARGVSSPETPAQRDLIAAVAAAPRNDNDQGDPL